MLAAVAVLALAFAPMAPEPEAAEGTASGSFEDKTWKLDLGGAYAFWDKSRGTDGDVRRIQVAVSNAEFLPEALDEHYDRRRAISTLFADEETKVVFFEFDASGGYHGLSYYFGPGSGCGWCFSTKVKSTVKAAGGRLKGRISYKEDDDAIRFDIALDVPIPPKEWGERLPTDGGAPGKAFLAYAAALERRDQKQIYALLDAAMKERFKEYEKEGRLEGWLDWRWTDEHTALSTIRITGGYERGDRAVVLFDGANSYIEKLHGVANLGRAAVTIGVLALGIGANTAIFSVVHAVLLKPLPFPEAERIVVVPHTPPQDIFPGRKYFSVSPANYYDWKAQNDVFSHMAMVAGGMTSLTGSGEPASVSAYYVTSEFFPIMGARPLAGRLLTAGDDEPGQAVVVISEELWKSRLGGSPSAVGSSMILDGKSHMIVGVLPAKLAYPPEARLWIPLVLSPEDRALRAIHDFGVLARLKPGISVDSARTQMNAIAARLAVQYPADNKGWGAAVLPFHEDLVGDVRPALLVLLGAVGFVLLIACANVANLVLARTIARRKEIAVRAALGAGRARIVRPILAETIVLAIAGGALGLLLAGLGVRLIVAFLGDQMPRVTDIRVDMPVLAFTFSLAILTGVLAGLLPAWRLSHANPNDALKQGGRSDADAGNPVLRHTLVAAEVALALVLMLGAGLLVRSLGRLQSVDPGFEPKNVLHARLSLPDGKYPENAKAAFFERMLERVRALPGVEAAGAMNTLPLTDGGSTQPVAIDGHPAVPLSEQPEVAVRILSPGTLQALRFKLIEGRDLSAADRADAPGAVLISEAMAKRFWPGESAVGKRLTLSFSPDKKREVVGVVADVKLRGLAKPEPISALYAPHAQMPSGWMALLVRTAQDPASATSALRGAIRAMDPDLPIVEIGTMEQHLGETLSHPRFNMLLLAVFAALALALSALGIYSVLSYAVRRRTREIGIRMALGANRRDVLRLIVLQGMRPAVIGLLVGLTGALALGRVLTSLVFGIKATDPATFVVAASLLGLVALAACAVPAWRASRVHPTEALNES